MKAASSKHPESTSIKTSSRTRKPQKKSISATTKKRRATPNDQQRHRREEQQRRQQYQNRASFCFFGRECRDRRSVEGKRGGGRRQERKRLDQRSCYCKKGQRRKKDRRSQEGEKLKLRSERKREQQEGGDSSRARGRNSINTTILDCFFILFVRTSFESSRLFCVIFLPTKPDKQYLNQLSILIIDNASIKGQRMVHRSE